MCTGKTHEIRNIVLVPKVPRQGSRNFKSGTAATDYVSRQIAPMKPPSVPPCLSVPPCAKYSLLSPMTSCARLLSLFSLSPGPRAFASSLYHTRRATHAELQMLSLVIKLSCAAGKSTPRSRQPSADNAAPRKYPASWLRTVISTSMYFASVSAHRHFNSGEW